MAPGLAGITAPGAGIFLLLNSSQICSIVTNSTPSCFIKCSMSLSIFRISVAITGSRSSTTVCSPFMH